MFTRQLPLSLAFVLLLLPGLGAPAGGVPRGQKPGTDCYGDPLPPGVVSRMGSVRLLQAGSVSALAFSPDSKALASGSWEGAVRLWEVRTGRELRRFTGHSDAVTCVAFSPDGKTLASGGRGENIRFWDVATGKERGRVIRPQRLHPELTALAFAPDGKTLASGSFDNYDPHIWLWVVPSGKLLRRWRAHRGGVIALAFAPGGKALASGGFAGWNGPKQPTPDAYAAALWDPTTGKNLYRLRGHRVWAGAVAFSADGKTLVTAGAEPVRDNSQPFPGIHPSLRRWRAADGKALGVREDKRIGDPQCLALSPDGKLLAAWKIEPRAVWDVTRGKRLFALGGKDSVTWAAFSPDGKFLATGHESGHLQIWDLARQKLWLASRGQCGPVLSAAVSPNGKTLATASLDGTVWLWEMATGKPRRQFRPVARTKRAPTVWCVAFSPDGNRLAMAQNAAVSLWDVGTGKRLWKVQAARFRVQAVAFSPDGKVLASSRAWEADNSGRLWEAATGKLLRQLDKTIESGRGIVAFSPDGRTLAGADRKGLYFWEAATGKLRYWRKERAGRVAFAPDGIVLASVGKSIGLWEVATGKPLGHLQGPVQDETMGELVISPDGRFLARARRNWLLLWDLTTGRQIRSFATGQGFLHALAFSPDGKFLVTAGGDGTALVWKVRFLTRGKGDPKALTPGEMRSVWTELNGKDGLRAYQAWLKLRHALSQAVALLREHLRRPRVAEAKINRLIADLNSRRYRVREKASRALEKLGLQAGPALRRALAGKPSPEVRRRVRALLKKLENFQEVRADWIVKLLEQLGTPEARRLLAELSRGPADARLTREAKAARKRLAKGQADRR
jgi:WD40 repeat protein